MKNYYEHLDTNNLDNLEVMDKLPEIHYLLIMNHEDKENWNRLITNKKTKSVMKNILTKINSKPVGFTGEFCRTFRKELIPTLFKLFQKTEDEEALPNALYAASILLTLKPDKDTRKLQAISLGHKDSSTYSNQLV